MTSKIKDIISNGKKYRVININPGFKDRIGHHLSMNKNLKSVVTGDGGDYLVLSNKNIEPDLIEQYKVVPAFTYSTWKLLWEGGNFKYYRSFKKELQDVITLINYEDKKTKNIFFMYLADVKHIPLIVEIAANIHNNRNIFVLNLLHSYNDFFSNGKPFDSISEETELIFRTTKDIRKNENIYLYVEVEELQNEIFRHTGEKVYLLPSFISAFSSTVLNQINHSSIDNVVAGTQKLTIYCPSYPTGEKSKGFEFIRDLIMYFKEKNALSLFKFVIRDSYLKEKKLFNLPEEIKNHVQLIEGQLTFEKYQQLFEKADLILIPYMKEEFYARTSGVFSDAVLTAKPVITTAETWAGRNTIILNNGKTFLEGDVISCYNAIFDLKNQYLNYIKNCIKARLKWLDSNSIEAFLKSIKKHLPDNNSKEPGEKNIQINNITGKNILDEKVSISCTDIIRLNRIIQNKNSIINEFHIEKDKIIKTHDSIIKQKDKIIEAMQNSLTWKITAPLRKIRRFFMGMNEKANEKS